MLVSAGSYYDYDPSTFGYGPYRAPDFLGGAGWLPFILVTSVVLLFGFAAIRQGRDWLRTRLPMQGALAAAYVLLAQAQVSQFLGLTWSPSWWEYHVLMLTAAATALGALFIELDRRRGLERFLPPTVVEHVIQGDPLRLEGERQTVTILFADLRGSTALAERLAPEEIVSVLNTYLRVMARAVIESGGILDKFLGDGLMAIFGAMGDPSHGASAATRARRAHARANHRAEREREAAGLPGSCNSLGCPHGDGSPVPLSASPERSDYTAIATRLTTASRMSPSRRVQVERCSRPRPSSSRRRRERLRPLGEEHCVARLRPCACSRLNRRETWHRGSTRSDHSARHGESAPLSTRCSASSSPRT